MTRDSTATPHLGDFETSSREVLKFLHRRLGFDLWMVTRTEGNDWIVLQSEDHGYGVEPGAVFRWTDSFCSQMVQGKGPRIAPRSDIVPAYAAAPIGREVKIKAYVGLPLLRTDGTLFGTLCAIHPSSQPESIVLEEELLELLGRLLSTILQAELRLEEEARRCEKLRAEALTDELTRLFNRRGWTQLLAAEDERCRRYGHPAAILIIDLDELKQVNDRLGHAEGDRLLERAADVLRSAARPQDIVARLGGDEFGILCTECDESGGEAVLQRVRDALAEPAIGASVGLAVREPSRGLDGAWKDADERMYAAKRSGASDRATALGTLGT